MALEKIIVAGIIISIIVILGAVLICIIPSRAQKKRITIRTRDGRRIIVNAEIANDIGTQMKGLMGRKTLDETEGMLFVFGESKKHSFWMMNTTILLEALHFASDGTLVDIVQMEPCKSAFNCPNYMPREASRYVLEVNAGFSKIKGIKIGDSTIDLTEVK
ncbi:DUF192 domain-containing protein [Candidatus Micrarchaeota archaeon]|nr:DUF192 domain-containing protein [Candidatus Micrarchaeota archaeon]